MGENGEFVFGAEEGPRIEAPAAEQKLDRSRFEKPLTLEESLQAQQLHTQLNRTVRSLSQRMEAEGVSPEQREALGEVRDTAQTIKDYNAKRLAGRITPDEGLAFRQLLDPAHAAESKAAPEVVKFTQELRQVMSREQDAPAKAGPEGPKPPVKQAPKLQKKSSLPGLGAR